MQYCSLFFGVDELQYLHRGQGLEIIWRDSLKCPSEEEYIDMANKSLYSSHCVPCSAVLRINCFTETSGLLRIACRLMMGCATSNVNM